MDNKNKNLMAGKEEKTLLWGAIDFHCHGIGRFDFTEIPEIELQEIEDILALRNHSSILTLYLPRHNLDDFTRLMDTFHRGKQTGKYRHIMGLALEGPLLASFGGTPHDDVWKPTQSEWRTIADCGRKGLIYSVCSPDACFSQDEQPNTVEWIIETLLAGGVLPAAGHFTKSNPTETAKALQRVYDIVATWGYGPTVTDHLYNDMPLNFKHAWRTSIEKEKRDEEMKTLRLDTWTLDNIEEKLGPVPATMIRNAKKGIVKIAQNFDGEHVDLAIVKKTVDLVGAENMMIITDSIESKRLAGRDLHMHEDSTLLYQDEDIVAAGSQGIAKQIQNMQMMGLTNEQIHLITYQVPMEVLDKRAHYINSVICERSKTACM